jgi:hypothetical protein
MTTDIPGRSGSDRELPAADIAVDGDASTYLEELVVGDLPTFAEGVSGDSELSVEVVGPHLRLSGRMGIGHFRRLSDFLNNHQGLIELHDATILRRNGDPTKVRTRSVWLNPTEVTLIGQADVGDGDQVGEDLRVPKVSKSLIVVTPGHTLTGAVHLMPEADLSVFIESTDPVFVPMTDVRTRSLADRRIITRYAFGLLNRRHIVATTELLPGMAPAGRSVL